MQLEGSTKIILRNTETGKLHCPCVPCNFSAKRSVIFKDHCVANHPALVPNDQDTSELSDLSEDEDLPAPVSSPEILEEDIDYEMEEKDSQFLTSIGFRLNHRFQILVCVDCEHACKPSLILGHLKSHNISRKNVKSQLDELVDNYNVREDHDILRPAPGGLAIEGIKICAGFECSECGYVCLEEGSVRKHREKYSSEHTFAECHAQTLFRPLPIRFFSVTLPEVHVDKDDLFQNFLHQVVPSLPEFSISDPSTVRELPLLLAKTLWHLYLDKWLKNPERRREIKSLAVHLLKGEVWSATLSEGVQKYMKATRDIAKQVDYIILRNMLKHSRYVFKHSFVLNLHLYAARSRLQKAGQ